MNISDTPENLLELEKEMAQLNKKVEDSLKENHRNIDDIFMNRRNLLIENKKTYLTNISIVCATIIPFSSLVFSIPKEYLIVNLYFWLISLFLFIISLGVFIYSYLELINSEEELYVKLMFGWLDSGNIEFSSLSKKNISEQTLEHVNILDSQEKFYRDFKKGISEESFTRLSQNIKRASIIFLLGLTLFFISIISNSIHNLLSNKEVEIFLRSISLE